MNLFHVVRHASEGSGKPPILILLHGVGSNERDMAALAPAMDPRFLVIAARSPLTIGPDAYAWFHVRFTEQGPAINAAEAETGWKALAQFIREVAEKYNGDSARVYVAGFSQGGIMALTALLTEPDLVAGAVCMSGRLLPDVLPFAAPRNRLAGKPVLIIHGSADNRLRVDYAHTARDTLEAFGLEVTFHELPIGHEITPESLSLATAWLAAHLDA